jgi:hypothetical protein
VHVPGADGADQHAVSVITQRENHEYLATLKSGSNRPKPLFALGILLVGQDHHRPAEHALDLSDRNPMFLALLAVAAIPIEAIKLDVTLSG